MFYSNKYKKKVFMLTDSHDVKLIIHKDYINIFDMDNKFKGQKSLKVLPVTISKRQQNKYWKEVYKIVVSLIDEMYSN